MYANFVAFNRESARSSAEQLRAFYMGRLVERAIRLRRAGDDGLNDGLLRSYILTALDKPLGQLLYLQAVALRANRPTHSCCQDGQTRLNAYEPVLNLVSIRKSLCRAYRPERVSPPTTDFRIGS